MKEYLLSTNKYAEPTTIEGSDAYGVLLTRLLLLQPGTNPLHPDMGVGLGPKYRFLTENDMSELQTLIQEQVNTYLPSEFMNATKVFLEIKENSHYLQIIVIADDTKYVFDTENSNAPMELSELIS